MNELPFVSVIIPCRNEGAFIGPCLDSLLASDYPRDRLEVLVIDGMSDDKTREVVEEYYSSHPFIRLIDNPARRTPQALNAGIREARGEVIVRVDAHAHFDESYISKCVHHLLESGADNVGGIMVTLPRDETAIGRSIVLALNHRFGVGNSYFRVHSPAPKWVDTVFGGCYRREVFEKVGMFNEKLLRGQDMEFNRRLGQAGGRILLVPEIVSYYYARSDMLTFMKHNFTNGEWAIIPFLYSPVMPVRPRHLVPLGFALAIVLLSAAALFSQFALWALIAVCASYLACSVLASAHVVVREKNPVYLFTMPLVFFNLHFWYGLGSLKGVGVVLWRLVRRIGEAPRPREGV